MIGSKAQHNPPVIPDHEIIRRIGDGSYGEVWLARNAIGQYRAVKVVYRLAFKDNRPFDREFSGVRNYEPISRSHPGLVNILQIGINQDGGYFYYVMELADDRSSDPGRPLDPKTYCPKTLRDDLHERRRLPIANCIQIGLDLASALDCLHQKGLVHRDIKPSNIIFVGGRVKLADIGLVTTATEEASRTTVGTEGYMPPEGTSKPQSDLYSLGKVLYEISTGQTLNDFPELPADLAEIPGRKLVIRLNEIIQGACDPNPAMRYAGAQDMMHDLLRVQGGKQADRAGRHAGKAKAALVLGIIGLFNVLIPPPIAFPISILGLVLGFKGLHPRRRRMALAGLIMTIIGLVAATGNIVSGTLLGGYDARELLRMAEAATNDSQVIHYDGYIHRYHGTVSNFFATEFPAKGTRLTKTISLFISGDGSETNASGSQQAR